MRKRAVLRLIMLLVTTSSLAAVSVPAGTSALGMVYHNAVDLSTVTECRLVVVMTAPALPSGSTMQLQYYDGAKWQPLGTTAHVDVATSTSDGTAGIVVTSTWSAVPAGLSHVEIRVVVFNSGTVALKLGLITASAQFQ